MLDEYEAAIGRLDAVLRACPDDRLAAPCWEVTRSAAWMPSWHPHAGETFGQLVRGNLDHLRQHTEHLAAVVNG